jgi:hypothetical protein
MAGSAERCEQRRTDQCIADPVEPPIRCRIPAASAYASGSSEAINATS